MYAEKLKELVIIILLILATAALHGQQTNMTEADVIDKASTLFEAEKWQEALPLFAQLVSVHPENPEYNYKFGVCTLLGNRSDRRRPIRYLNIAYRSMGDETELLYYLGLAYYQNQEFANAMKFMNLYLARLGANDPQRPKILEMVNASLNGMNLEHKNLVDEFVSTTEFKIDNFYRAYRADDFEGSLILKPDEFTSEKEKNNGEKSFVFVSEPRGVLYFSGYHPSNTDQRDIFRVELKENGKWDKPVPISNKVNTNFDEAYPIVTDDGQTLYFSSKGHNSIGGYDIFMSTFDPETKDFGTPENMGMGINSPFDDVLFIPEKNGSGAYFASNRDNLGDDINVFRVRMNNEGFADQHMLAEQSIQTKLDNIAGGSAAEKTIAANTASTTTNDAAPKKPLDPQQKGINLVEQRNRMNKMADTAFLLVSNMKNLIRDLTNKRDRANMVSSSKLDQAKKLEIEFERLIADLATAENKEAFEDMLARAVKYKEDIYQYRQRADQANLIAWNLGKQLKVKNEELKKLKLDAGEVQTQSLSGNFAQTNETFTLVMQAYHAADTLTDYSQNINWINLDKITFDIPDTEIAFIGQMREAYENQTLLAAVQANKVPEGTIDESVPIRVIDNRSANVPAPKPNVTVFKQVEAVDVTLAASELIEEETLELRFAIDAIEPETLVDPVMVAFQEQELIEDDLELRFGIDAVPAIQLIDPVLFVEETVAQVDEADLELNFKVDQIDALPVPEKIPFDETEYAFQMDEETLEINSSIDWITPETLVTPIAFQEDPYAVSILEEELDIDTRIDWIEPENIVEAIAFNELEPLMEEENLEINTTIDAVQPIELVDQITMPQKALAIADDESLEIRSTVDVVKAAGLVEDVVFTETPMVFEEENLEINIEKEVIETLPVVETIAFNEAESFSIDPEDLDVRIENESIDPVPLVSKVSFEPVSKTGLAMEEQLEITIEPDVIVAEEVVETIAYNETGSFDIDHENLDVRIEPETIEAVAVVSAVSYEPMATSGFALEEQLEITIEPDVIVAEEVVETIAYNETGSFDIDHEDLDVRIEPETIEAVALVSAVSYEPMATSGFALEEQLEINIEPDVIVAEPIIETIAFQEKDNVEISNDELEVRIEPETVKTFALVSAIAYQTASTTLFTNEEQLEVNIEPDVFVAEELVEAIAFNVPNDFEMDIEDLELSFTIDEAERESLMADNAAITSRDVSGTPEIPAAGTELYYLRESVSMSADIETSRTDTELLSIAVKNPEDLSYEELLFAASIAPIPEDKLRIYNYAFIHIDRDWRAFNNAAVTAMRIKDLDQAEVYLYQASLISNENGKVENNKGILACYKNDFNSAENHFLAASQLGVNAEYNLQLIQQLVRTSGNNVQDMKGEMGKVNMRK